VRFDDAQPGVFTGSRLVFLLAAVLFAGAVLFTLPTATLSGLISDDALFYATIARNMAEGSFSTFDGIEPTNGYHPLWLVVLTAVFSVISASGIEEPSIQLRLLLCFDVLCVLWTILLTDDLLVRVRDHAAGTVTRLVLGLSLGLYLIAFPLSASMLMEDTLVCLLLAWLLRDVAAGRDKSAVLLVPALFLARIDLLPLCLLVAAFLWISPQLRRRGPMLTLACTVGAYAAFNALAFGHLTTVSSYIKSRMWDHSTLIDNFVSQVVELDNRVALLVLTSASALVAALAGRRWRDVTPHARTTYLLMLVTGIAGLAYIAGMLAWNGNLRTWYFGWPLWICSTVLFASLDGLRHPASWLASRIVNPRTRKTIVIAACLGISTISVLGIAHLRRSRDWHEPHSRYGHWLRHALPEGEPVLQVDSAGHIAFFSRRNVISADGLVGSFEYARSVHDRTLCQYLIDHEVTLMAVDGEVRRSVIEAGPTLSWKGNRIALEPYRQLDEGYYIYRLRCRAGGGEPTSR
jgi:hypothetical protein